MLERLSTVPVEDEDLARRGRLLNILLLGSIAIVTAIDIVFIVVAEFVGQLPLQALIPPSLVGVVSLYCLWLARRGRVREGIWLYLGVNFLAIAASIYIFDGFRSPAMLLFFWPISLTGMLLQPRLAFGTALLSVFVGILALILQRAGLYTPLVVSGSEARDFTTLAFNLIVYLGLALLIFLTVGNLNRALHHERELRATLQAHRATLEQQVAERTRDLERRAMQLQAAAEVAREAAAIRDVDQLLDTTVRLISDRFGFYHAGVFLLDDAREHAVLRAASSEGGRRMLARGHRLKVGEVGIVGWVAGTGKPRVALDVGADAVFFDNPDLPETRSEMALPLRVRGEVIGVLDVQSTEEAAFTEEAVAVLQTLADQLAVAIENARLFQEAQARLRETEVLYREYSREAWGALARARRVRGYTYDRVGISPVTADWPPEVRQALQKGQIVTIGGGGGRDGAALAVPIRVRGEVIGVLDIRRPLEAGEWTSEETALVERVSTQLGLALESARLYQDTQRRAVRERLAADITARVRASTEVDTILQTAIRELGRALRASEGLIRLGSGDEVSLLRANKGDVSDGDANT
ncbi:MAG: hypothetical protein DRI79_03630 [Chloroflexi bacterium]|nr:MAG: hypothetical protein DRI80_01680 [Chloroflexota bacterium]RLC91152.1 MAG: hypothetical protein DRI79_03630 [Chloroflexota bacterium]